ncbi:MAG: hypothetical protein R2862_01220 [Thermoanaerobaculia bacterium]
MSETLANESPIPAIDASTPSSLFGLEQHGAQGDEDGDQGAKSAGHRLLPPWNNRLRSERTTPRKF